MEDLYTVMPFRLLCGEDALWKVTSYKYMYLYLQMFSLLDKSPFALMWSSGLHFLEGAWVHLRCCTGWGFSQSWLQVKLISSPLRHCWMWHIPLLNEAFTLLFAVFLPHYTYTIDWATMAVRKRQNGLEVIDLSSALVEGIIIYSNDASVCLPCTSCKETQNFYGLLHFRIYLKTVLSLI